MRLPKFRSRPDRCGFCQSRDHVRADCPAEAYHGRDAVSREDVRAYDRQIRRAQQRRGWRG